jgi:hypothetical protein
VTSSRRAATKRLNFTDRFVISEFRRAKYPGSSPAV